MAKRAVFLGIIGIVAISAAYLPSVSGIFAQEEKTEPVKKEQIKISDEAKLAFDKGMEFYGKGNYDKSIAAFKEAAKIEPKYAQAYCEMGVAYMEKEDFKDAIPNILKSIEIQPIYPKAHYAVAVAYARQEKPDIANARKQLQQHNGLLDIWAV